MAHSTKHIIYVLGFIVLLLFGLKLNARFGKQQPIPQPELGVTASPSGQPTSETASVTPSISGTSARKFVTAVLGNNNDFSVEVARTPAEITQGLSGRATIGSDGMLFVIDPPKKVQFWMLGMRFPLDFIWISNGKVVGVEHDISVPSPNVAQNKLPTYSPPTSVDYVLEVPGGMAAKLGIVQGTTFTIR